MIQDKIGDTEAAIESLRRAISLMPPERKPIHPEPEELFDMLAEFEHTLSGSSP